MKICIPKETAHFNIQRTSKTKKWFVIACDKDGNSLGRVFSSQVQSGIPSRLRYSDDWAFPELIARALNVTLQIGKAQSK